LSNKKAIGLIKAQKTTSGEYFVGWGYKYSGVTQYINIKKKTTVSYFDLGYPI